MALTYDKLADRIRKDALSKPLMTSILRNMNYVQNVALAGHTPDGLHNELLVSRGVATVQRTVGAISLSGNTSWITNVDGFTDRGAVGVATLTLSSGKFTLPMRVDVTCTDTLCESKPYLATVEVVSATSVIVRTYSLTSALGAANVWGAKDCTFSISIHSAPYTSAAAALTAITEPKFNDALESTVWNQLVANQATQRSNALVGHSSAGVHSVREVARAWARVGFNSGPVTYSLDANSTNISSVSRTSIGRCHITLPGSTYTLPLQICHRSGWASDNAAQTPSDLFIVNFPDSQVTTTGLEAWIYKYDFAGKTWARADCDFDLAIHTT